jgi:ankyrin repeat protein
MIGAGVDVNEASVPRRLPIHLAIEQQHLGILRLLIRAGADIHLDLGDGWTPLVHAIDIESDAAWQHHQEPGRESTDLTELLLSEGARPTAEALKAAEEYNNLRALALLRKYAGDS